MTEPAVVEPQAAPYTENPDFVPDPTAVYGTLDTSGTAGGDNEKLEKISPVFDAAKAQDVAYAAMAIDPENTDVDDSSVVLPGGERTTEDAKTIIQETAKGFEEEPVPVQDPSITDANRQAEKSGQQRTEEATAQQAQQGAGVLGSKNESPSGKEAFKSTTEGSKSKK